MTRLASSKCHQLGKPAHHELEMKTYMHRGRKQFAGRPFPTTKPRLERLEDRSLMTAGLLDTSFNGVGFAQTAIGNSNDSATVAVVQPDGKSVVGGTTVQADGSTVIAFTRYNRDGSLDTGFGSGGTVVVALPNMAIPVSGLDGIALQPDGKIVAVSDQRLSGYPTLFQIAVTRLNPNGSLDLTFGNGGTTITPLSDAGGARSVALQSDGKIVIGGDFLNESIEPHRWNFAIWRYTAVGVLDSTFNGTGFVLTDFGSDFGEHVYSLKIQPDGKIVAAGSMAVPPAPTFDDTALARYNTDGTLDTTFGVGGKETIDLSGGGVEDYAQSLGIQSLSGGSFRLITTGFAEIVDPSNPNGVRPVMLVAGLTPSGTLDPAFGTGGIVKTEPPAMSSSGAQVRYWYGTSLAIQGDGKIIVSADGATTASAGFFALERYTADGAVDTSFGSGGTSSIIDQLNGAPIESGGVNSLALDAAGRIYMVGQIDTNPSSSTGLDFLIARFTNDIVTALAEAGKQTIAHFAQTLFPDFPAGGAPGVSFIVTNNNNKLFSIQPAIDPAGTLTFKPAANKQGVATVTVILHRSITNGTSAVTGGEGEESSGDETADFTIEIEQQAPWQNDNNDDDVDDDNHVAPIDGLLVIDYLNGIGSGAITSWSSEGPFFDTSGDNIVSPEDALLVINVINAGIFDGPLLAAGESASASECPASPTEMPQHSDTTAAGPPPTLLTTSAPPTTDSDLLNLLALDAIEATSQRRRV